MALLRSLQVSYRVYHLKASKALLQQDAYQEGGVGELLKSITIGSFPSVSRQPSTKHKRSKGNLEMAERRNGARVASCIGVPAPSPGMGGCTPNRIYPHGESGCLQALGALWVIHRKTREP